MKNTDYDGGGDDEVEENEEEKETWEEEERIFISVFVYTYLNLFISKIILLYFCVLYIFTI